MLVLSSFCYCVTLGTGWPFYRKIVPHDHCALAAAIISTIPIVAFFVYIFFDWNFGRLVRRLQEGAPVNQCELVCFISIGLVVGILEAIGGIIFLATVAGASVKTLGIVAGISGLLSGCSFCGGFCGFYYQFRGERYDI